jgi:hypothetical protein
MTALSESQIVQELKSVLERVNARNSTPGLNETAKLLDSELVTVLAQASAGSKSLREQVAAILAEYPLQRKLP